MLCCGGRTPSRGFLSVSGVRKMGICATNLVPSPLTVQNLKEGTIMRKSNLCGESIVVLSWWHAISQTVYLGPFL